MAPYRLESLAQRFAYAAAAMAGIAMLVIAGMSMWLINQEHAASVESLLKKETDLQAVTISDNLRGIAARMSELAKSNLIENALIDDTDRDRLLVPYLSRINDIQGKPIAILFTDFQGREIASNGNGRFGESDLQWLRQKLAGGQVASRVQAGEKGDELLAVEFIALSPSSSVEGALLYKISLNVLGVRSDTRLVHGQASAQLLQSQAAIAVAVEAPPIYKNIGFAIVARAEPVDRPVDWKWLGVFFLMACGLMVMVIMLGLYIGKRLTQDLLRLQLFTQQVFEAGFGASRAEVADSIEVAGLAQSINSMLERLTQQHQKLSESEERFRTLFEYSDVGMNVRNAGSNYVAVNPAFAKMMGYSQEALLGMNFNDITHSDSIQPGLVRINTLLTGQSDHFQMEKKFVRKDGTTLWGDVSVSAVRDSAGKLVSFIGVTQDITRRKQAEAALAESFEKLRLATAAADLYDWEWDVLHDTLSWGRNPAHLLGQPDEQTGQHPDFRELVHPEDRERYLAVGRHAIRTGELYSIECRILARDGSVRWIAARGKCMFDSVGTPVRMIGVTQDITARKQAETELVRFKNILDNTLDMIFMFEPETLRFVYANQGAVLTMGYSREELYGMTAFQIKPFTSEAKFLQRLAPLLSGERQAINFDTLHRRKDGTDFPVSVFLQLVTQSDGSRLFVAIVQDITERKQAQDNMLRLNASLEERVQQRTAQLQASNRNMEEFAYSVAHDLRQPFIAIGGFSGLLARTIKDERATHYIDRIKAGVQKAGELTDSLLALANLSRVELRLQPIDLSAIARSVMEALRRDSPYRQASVRIEPGLVVQADPVLIEQMMYELLINAWKFTSRRNHTEISFGRVPPQADTVGGMGSVPVYEVKDNGTGFDMTLADKLFRSFQRLHAAQEFPGAGASLVKVQRIVERHHGRIWAEAKLGEGARFFFTLDSVWTDGDQ